MQAQLALGGGRHLGRNRHALHADSSRRTFGVESILGLEGPTLPDRRVPFTIYEDEMYIGDRREAVIQYNGIVLLDHFITLELGDHICWWDPEHWGRDGFIESAVAL